MSYIRSGSNPEGLYIWAEADGRVHIFGGLPISKLPKNNDAVVIPCKLFERVAKRWARDFEDVRQDGLVVREVHVNFKTGKTVPADAMRDNLRESAFLIRLSWKKYRIFMWRVTWAYIVNNVVGRAS